MQNRLLLMLSSFLPLASFSLYPVLMVLSNITMFCWLSSQWDSTMYCRSICLIAISTSQPGYSTGKIKSTDPLEPDTLVTLPSIRLLKIETWKSVHVTKLNEATASANITHSYFLVLPFIPFLLLWSWFKTLLSPFLSFF